MSTSWLKSSSSTNQALQIKYSSTTCSVSFQMFKVTYMNSSWSVSALLNCCCVGALPVIPCHPFSLEARTTAMSFTLINPILYQCTAMQMKATTSCAFVLVDCTRWQQTFKCMIGTLMIDDGLVTCYHHWMSHSVFLPCKNRLYV